MNAGQPTAAEKTLIGTVEVALSEALADAWTLPMRPGRDGAAAFAGGPGAPR